MPIFKVDQNGTAVRAFVTKAKLRDQHERRVQKLNDENERLTAELADADAAIAACVKQLDENHKRWDADVLAFRDVCAREIALTAKLDETERALKLRTAQRDLLIAGEETFPDELEQCSDVMSQLLGAAREEAQVWQERAKYAMSIIERTAPMAKEASDMLHAWMDNLLALCDEADAKRAKEGRHGRVGTPAIRALIGEAPGTDEDSE